MNPGTLQLLLTLTTSLNDIITSLRDNPNASPEDIAQLHSENTALAQAVIQQLDEGIADPNR